MAPMYQIGESETGRYTATLISEMGVAVPASALETLTLTLYDTNSGNIINDRDGQDVLNKSDVTVDESGHLIWELRSEDTPIVNTTPPVKHGTDQDGHYVEPHIALFVVTWQDATERVRRVVHEVSIGVIDYAKVPR